MEIWALSCLTITGPDNAPKLPPEAIIPKKRLEEALENRSAIKLQNKETTKRLKTLSQMKKQMASERKGPSISKRA